MRTHCDDSSVFNSSLFARHVNFHGRGARLTLKFGIFPRYLERLRPQQDHQPAIGMSSTRPREPGLWCCACLLARAPSNTISCLAGHLRFCAQRGPRGRSGMPPQAARPLTRSPGWAPRPAPSILHPRSQTSSVLLTGATSGSSLLHDFCPRPTPRLMQEKQSGTNKRSGPVELSSDRERCCRFATT